MLVFWVVKSCGLACRYQRFGETCLQLHGKGYNGGEDADNGLLGWNSADLYVDTNISGRKKNIMPTYHKGPEDGDGIEPCEHTLIDLKQETCLTDKIKKWNQQKIKPSFPSATKF